MSRFTDRDEPEGKSRALSVGLGILLIAVGAFLLFALTARSLHIVGIILIVAGAFALLSVLAHAMLSSGWPRTSWVSPSGTQGYAGTSSDAGSDPGLAEIREAAASDVAEMQDDGRFVDPDAPGRMEDDL